jgi:hypothetical protein
VKLVSVFVLLALLLSAGAGVAMAQESPIVDSAPTPTLAPSPNEPSNDMTDADLEKFVDLAINE